MVYSLSLTYWGYIMLYKLIDSIKEYFYTPKSGDRYYFHFTDNPWDVDKRKKNHILYTRIK